MAVVIAVPGNEDKRRSSRSRLGAEVDHGRGAAVSRRRDLRPDRRAISRGQDVVLVGSLYPVPAERVPDGRVPRGDRARPRRAQGRAGRAVPRVHAAGRASSSPARASRRSYFARARVAGGRLAGHGRSAPAPPRRRSSGIYSIPTTIARAAPAIAQLDRDARSSSRILVGPDAESVQWVSAVADALRRAVRDPREDAARRSRRLDHRRRRRATGTATRRSSIDDIISTGKTMIEATRQLRAAGSAAPMCVAIHAVFADDVLERADAAGAAGIVTCDTIVARVESDLRDRSDRRGCEELSVTRASLYRYAPW